VSRLRRHAHAVRRASDGVLFQLRRHPPTPAQRPPRRRHRGDRPRRPSPSRRSRASRRSATRTAGRSAIPGSGPPRRREPGARSASSTRSRWWTARGRPRPTTRWSSTSAAPTRPASELGDPVCVQTQTDLAEYEIVGVARLETADSPDGATLAIMTLQPHRVASRSPPTRRRGAVDQSTSSSVPAAPPLGTVVLYGVPDGSQDAWRGGWACTRSLGSSVPRFRCACVAGRRSHVRRTPRRGWAGLRQCRRCLPAPTAGTPARSC
jgi:hypothetical protein